MAHFWASPAARRAKRPAGRGTLLAARRPQSAERQALDLVLWVRAPRGVPLRAYPGRFSFTVTAPQHERLSHPRPLQNKD
jgi:hypothetical protein